MSRIIEADFLPRETEAAVSRLNSLCHVKQQRILIIDRDKNTTSLVRILLERTGRYLVFEEDDLLRAHQIVRNFQPDMILLDVNMLNADGGEVAARIRADSELQSTPIVFLGSLVTPGDANNGFGIGKQALLAKPIDIQELIKTIEAHVRSRPRRPGA